MFLRSWICVLTFIGILLPTAIAQASQDPPSEDYTCSSSKPCKLGCCSKGGVCGLGPTFCGSGNCTSSCDQKSECDPGWGSQWSSREKCPLSVCCSKFGFCGTTKEFCGDKTVKKPSGSGATSNQRTIGYYEGWSMTRPCGQFPPEQLPAGAYSHLNFAFAFIDPSSYKVAPMSDSDVELYPRFTGLKDSNPGLKTWISIGGWSMNDPDQPTAATFSNLAASSSAQSSFFASLLAFMSTHGFDGVDIDWEYPVAPERSGKPEDYKNYVSFLTNLKKALGSSGHNYGLTLTLPSSYWYMQNFDIVNLEKIVDWFNVMTYDLHGTWDSTDRFIGPIVNAHTNLTEIDQTMDLFWRNDIDPAKIVMGVGFYGRSFTLSDPSCSKPGCGFSGGASPGKCSSNAGTLMFSEIQDIIAAGATVTLDKEAAVKQVVWDNNQWVSYDDGDTFKMKIDFANKLGLGGLMVWAISTDDTKWTATRALTGHTGFKAEASFSGGQSTLQKQPITNCQWGQCGKEITCPAGMSPAQSGNGKKNGPAGIYSGCKSGQKRGYCCPSDSVPSCTWRGTAPACNGKCLDTEINVSSDSRGGGAWCSSGHKVLCCTHVQGDSQIGQCKWEGASPYCSAIPGTQYGCNEKERKSLTYSSYGAGGEARCLEGYKSLCCTQPPSFTGCSWTGCLSTGCPSGKQVVAVDGNLCPIPGKTRYFCCDQTRGDDQDPDAVPPNFCVAPEDAYVLSGEQDGDGNVADVLEVYEYEQDCFSVPNTAEPDLRKRFEDLVNNLVSDSIQRRSNILVNTVNGTSAKVCLEDGECYFIPELDFQAQTLLEQIRQSPSAELVPRGSVRTPKICLSGGRSHKMTAKAYPRVSVLGATKDFYRVAKSGIRQGACQALPLLAGSRVASEKYVVEHATELQTPAKFANSMLKGILPAGDKAFSASYNWESIFGPNGFFQKSFSSLGVKVPSGLTGNTPEEAIFNAFGTSKDTTNLLILDERTNSVKTAVWSIFENIIGDNKWNDANHATRVEYILRLQQGLMDYLNNANVQKAFEYTYKAQQAVWAVLDTAAGKANNNLQPIPSSSFALAHKAWYADFFLAMEENLAAFLHNKLTQEVSYWRSPLAVRDFSASAAKINAKTLSDKLASLATDVAIKRGWIQ